MYLPVDLIEEFAVIGVVCWLVYKVFSPPSSPAPKEPEKLCEPWWKSHQL